MDKINEYFLANQAYAAEHRVFPAIHCADGFHISVQAHYGAYSQPRANDAVPYSKVECGFPSGPVPQLAQWKDGSAEQRDEECVYGYVPVGVVADLIEAHGGFAAQNEVSQ
jgi:hypothetical protein